VIGDKVYALSVIWKAAGKKINADVITTVATSRVVEDVAAKFGAKVRYTAIGAPHLCEEMQKNPGFLAGEEVGGVVWPEISMAKDGFFTAVEAVCEKPLSEWLTEVPVYYNVKMKIEADANKKEKIVRRVLDYAEKKKLSYLTVDGVRINFNDGWVIVRASGTENYIRIFAEAKTKEEAQRIADEYMKIASG
jgi:phosphomannomutase/phosphoglucomutase